MVEAAEPADSKSDSKSCDMISGSCYPSRNELHGGDEQPCRSRGDGLLEVLGEASVPVEPCQRALDHPTAGQDLEALCGVGSLDDLDGPFADAAQRILEFVSGIAAIGEDMPQPREALDDFRSPRHWARLHDLALLAPPSAACG